MDSGQTGCVAARPAGSFDERNRHGERARDLRRLVRSAALAHQGVGSVALSLPRGMMHRVVGTSVRVGHSSGNTHEFMDRQSIHGRSICDRSHVNVTVLCCIFDKRNGGSITRGLHIFTWIMWITVLDWFSTIPNHQ